MSANSLLDEEGRDRDHWQYLQEVVSASNSERYVYTGPGLRSTEHLHRSDGPSRNPVETSDIQSRCSRDQSYYLGHYRYPRQVGGDVDAMSSSEFSMRPPQRSVTPLYHPCLYENRGYVVPRYGRMLIGDYPSGSRTHSLTSERGINCPSVANYRQPEFHSRGGTNIPTRLRGVIGLHPTVSSSISSLSIVGDGSSVLGDFEENTDSVPSGSSIEMLSSIYDSAVSDPEDTQSSLASGCSTVTILCGSMSRRPNADRQCRHMSSRKETYKKGSTAPTAMSHSRPKSLPTSRKNFVLLCQSTKCSRVTCKTQHEHQKGRTSDRPTVNRTIDVKRSKRQYDCLITYASDATTKRQIAAEYLIARGYHVMTDVPSCAIASYPTLVEKDIMKKLEKIFHKCAYVLCFMSEEYVQQMVSKKSKDKQMHIRFFVNLMEDEYKRNGKTNRRFLPIYTGSKYSKMNNMPQFLTCYPNDKYQQFQELVHEALN